MACGDVLSLEDLQTAKKHQIFEAEVITGRAGGVAGGASIDYAINQVTGQTQKTMPAILRDLGFEPASFDFTSGGTLGVNDRSKAVLWPLSSGGDGYWYYWEGALPKVIPASSTPASTGGVADGAWRPVGDVTLREDLAESNGSSLVGFIQSGTGSVPRTAQDKMRDIISIKDFGAVGDGVTIDTSALLKAIAATPSGGTLDLGNGPKNYLVDQTIVITKPIVIRGGAKEQTVITFATAGTYLASPYKAGFVFVHSATTVPGYSGDARRSRLIGFTVKAQSQTSGMRGIQAHAPIYTDSVDVTGFGSDGVYIAASNGTISGNANGSSFKDSYAFSNGGSGFVFSGDDANACVLVGCRSFANTVYGFFDDSLLGNVYVGCETDANTGGGYFATDAKPNRSAYFGCYAENNQAVTWNVGSRCVRFGNLGSYEHNRAHNGVVLGCMPGGDAYINKGLAFASTEDIANAGGTGAFPGAFCKVDYTGWTYRYGATTAVIRFNGNASPNYTDFTVDDVPVIRFPNSAVTGNLAKNRPYNPNGLSIGSSGRSAIVGAGTAAPTTGTYDAGAIWLNDLPTAGGFIGWVCVTAGTPGVWKTFGAISA